MNYNNLLELNEVYYRSLELRITIVKEQHIRKIIFKENNCHKGQ